MDATYYPARIRIYLEVLLPFVKDVVRNSPPLRILVIVMLLAITILFLVPVLSELCCANSKLLATILL